MLGTGPGHSLTQKYGEPMLALLCGSRRRYAVVLLLLMAALSYPLLMFRTESLKSFGVAGNQAQKDFDVAPTLTSDALTAAVTKTVTVYQNVTVEVPVQVEPEQVVFALIMFSEDSAAEGAMLVKSVIMHSSVPVEFHIICDQSAQEYLERRLRLVSHPAHDVRATFYRVAREAIEARIKREGAIYTDHSAGAYGLMKLFIHEILPTSVERVIFVDTDALFISDPSLLWRVFSSFPEEVAISMPSHPDQNVPEWHHASKICSCIMLLDLARLRSVRLMDSSSYREGNGRKALSPPAFVEMFGPPGSDGHYEGVKLGDQGYWWAIVSGIPNIFQHLSFEWEVSSCLVEMYGTGASFGDDGRTYDEEAELMVHTLETDHWGEAILPKMLHFNCLDGTPHYYEWAGWADASDSLNQRWGSTVRHYVGYKWIWLNIGRRGHPSEQAAGTMEIRTEEEVLFADEIYAKERHAHALHHKPRPGN